MMKHWLSNICSYLILDVKQTSVREEILSLKILASKKEKALRLQLPTTGMGIICFLYEITQETRGSRSGSTPHQLCDLGQVTN